MQNCSKLSPHISSFVFYYVPCTWYTFTGKQYLYFIKILHSDMKFPIVKISNKKRSVFISIFPICNFIAFLSYNICSQGPHSLDTYCITVRAILHFIADLHRWHTLWLMAVQCQYFTIACCKYQQQSIYSSEESWEMIMLHITQSENNF